MSTTCNRCIYGREARRRLFRYSRLRRTHCAGGVLTPDAFDAMIQHRNHTRQYANAARCHQNGDVTKRSTANVSADATGRSAYGKPRRCRLIPRATDITNRADQFPDGFLVEIVVKPLDHVGLLAVMAVGAAAARLHMRDETVFRVTNSRYHANPSSDRVFFRRRCHRFIVSTNHDSGAKCSSNHSP